jgi:hypothetical protein
MKREGIDVGELAIKKFGKDKQMDMIIEECSELIKCIVKLRRYNGNEVWRQKTLEEVADVMLMMEQAVQMLSTSDEFEAVLDYKIRNLNNIVNNDSSERGMKK